MKLKPEQIAKLSADMEAQRSRLGLTYAEIARKSDIDPGQVSRICRGEIKRLSANVMQICTILSVRMDVGVSSSANRLNEAILAIWDGTPEDAERLANLLAAVQQVRG
ncbi:helix-turn-helix transcriptional regulator [Aquamicrobium lusatiense]|uniref:helix-turn-helix transcriptional regulator n=1 Tax=Aquamicrobium lusatiense TaxID=89772 RepID=UPI002454C50B|nr:helix-turn-helix transcriptional regulator [Aquamicrobium lusatiense]MDH4990687.1 helix-turn-helix transcriptional regulator [Aquamicrobium lusatiense]